MATKPKTPGSGRQKGTPNKRTLEVLEIAKKFKYHPFELLMLYAHGDHEALGLQEYTVKRYGAGDDAYEISELTISPELRQKSARDAAPYVAPTLKAVEHSVDDETVAKMISYEEYLKSLK